MQTRLYTKKEFGCLYEEVFVAIRLRNMSQHCKEHIFRIYRSVIFVCHTARRVMQQNQSNMTWHVWIREKIT